MVGGIAGYDPALPRPVAFRLLLRFRQRRCNTGAAAFEHFEACDRYGFDACSTARRYRSGQFVTDNRLSRYVRPSLREPTSKG
jgi:hypothetical protein